MTRAKKVAETYSQSESNTNYYTKTTSDSTFVPKVRPIIAGQVGSISSITGPALVGFDDFWVNQGGINYSVGTKRFTVPTTGVYRIAMNPFSNTSGFRLLVGINTDTPGAANHRGHCYAATGTYTTMSIDSVVSLNANDYIVFYLSAGTLYNLTNDRFNQFSIELVG